MAGNLYQRYVWLLDIISRRQGVTFDEINRRWLYSALNDTKESLPKRTFHNHINAIYDLFGIKISCPPNSGYRYRIEESGDINLRDSQSSLLQHLQISNAMFNNPRLKGRVVMDRIQMQRHFTPLITAMDEGRAVKITCHRYGKEPKIVKDLILEPYFLKQFKSWFVVGRVQQDNEIHAFTFKSIHSIELTDIAYEMPESFDVVDYITQPLYFEPNDIVADDSDTLLLERFEDRLPIYLNADNPAEVEADYSKTKLENEDVVSSLLEREQYRKDHAKDVVLYESVDFDVILSCSTPNREPFVNVDDEDNYIEVAIEDGSLISVVSQDDDAEPSDIEQLRLCATEWLNSPCQDSHFNGTNRDYALWMWGKLEM